MIFHQSQIVWCQCLLVVSNIALPRDLPLMEPKNFLHSSIKDFIINVNNNYRYLKTGYYVSLHAEILGDPVIPTTENAIDAYRPPILLLRASKAGIPSSPYVVAASVKRIIEEVGFPVVLFALNPSSFNGYAVAKYRSALYRAFKSLSMNYKFAVCAEPLQGEIVSVNCFFGKCMENGKVEEAARRVFEVFGLPICKLHFQIMDGKPYLCGLQPVKKQEIGPHETQIIVNGLRRFLDGKEWPF